MNNEIYIDNAATTKILPGVLEAMEPWFVSRYGNPSATYEYARDSKNAIENARNIIAESLNAKKSEVYFTSGGSEADNWAIKGVADLFTEKGAHIITSKIEHHAVINTCKYLATKGYNITYLDVNQEGYVDIQQLNESICRSTFLISIMAANNEIGIINPMKEIGDIAKKNSIIFHTDAVQAYGHCEIDVKSMNIDLLSASAHKFGGPKGIGFLYVKNGIDIQPLIHGGKQEFGKRAGTENVPLIVGMAKAVELRFSNIAEWIEEEEKIRNYLKEEVLKGIPNVSFNGPIENRLSNNLSFTVEGVNGDAIVNLMSKRGFYFSTGAACSSGEFDISHVLLEIGRTRDEAENTIRMSIDRSLLKEDVDNIVKNLSEIVNILRCTGR